MASQVKLDYGAIEAELGRMKSASADFHQVAEKGFSAHRESLNDMESGFAKQLEKVLETVENLEFAALDRNITKYVNLAEKAYQDIKRTDEQLSGRI